MQDVQLYAFGVVFNTLRAILVRASAWFDPSVPSPPSLFEAPTAAWLVAMNMALLGLSVSWVMKHAGTLAKVYGNILASLMTLFMSRVYFDLEITLPLVLGIATVCAGAALYYMAPEALLGSSPEVIEQIRKITQQAQAEGGTVEPSHTRASTHPSIVAVPTALGGTKAKAYGGVAD